MKVIGILYHPKLDEGRKLADRLARTLKSSGYSVWYSSAWEEQEFKNNLDDSELIISIGGDGTILRTARSVLQNSIPILGINLGRLGFMTELTSEEADQKLLELLSGKSWIDERTMLQASTTRSANTFHALNDVVVGRGAVIRAINVDINIDNVYFASHRTDAIILATATGSTAYSLAAGGPVLHPESQNILLQPVATHFGFDNCLVLPATANVKLTVHAYHSGLLSIDGQNNLPLEDGEEIEIKRSPFSTRFIRFKPKGSFYSMLAQRLVRK